MSSGGPWQRFRRSVGAAALAWSCMIATAAAADLRGRPEILSGDRLIVAGKMVALYGALAPQQNQRCFDKSLPWWCGKYAREHLDRLINGAEVVCLDKGRTEDGHLLGHCRLRDIDLSEAQIAAGMAKADPRRGSAYLQVEQVARVAQTGIWHGNAEGTFVP